MSSAPACAHCGLRLGRRAVGGTIGGVRESFCCGGCLLAAHVTRARGEPSVASALLVRAGLAAFFTMNVMMLTMPTYARHVYGESADGPLFVALRWLAAALSVPVLLLLGGPILAGAREGLARRQAGADLLVALAVSAAFVLSVTNLLAGRPDTYFDTTVMLLVLVTLGRFTEASARARATEAVRSRTSVGPRTATRLQGGGRDEVEPEALVAGDLVEVAPGSAFPTDGVVVRGEADVDESMLTGERRPRARAPGDAVAGGTVSLDGRLVVRVERPAHASAQARIEALLAEARAEPTRIERSVDRIASFVVPLVMLIAAVAGAVWTWADGIDRGVLAAIAVLVVACPCGLVLATPVAIARGLAAAAHRGVVLRSAPVLERAASVRAVYFDKTGTLTGAEPRVAAARICAGGSAPDELLALAAAVEEGIAHPLARAIVREARRRGLPRREARDVRLRPGRGAEGWVGTTRVAVGTAAWIESLGLAAGAPGDESGARVVVATDAGDAAVLTLEEALVPGAEEAVHEVRALGATVRLVSGDSVPADEVRAPFARDEIATGLSPEGKLALLDRARLEGRGPIAMVGDGVNDAPALAAADVGIAVASASDLARLSADAAVLGGGLSRVPWLLAHARRVRRVVRQNLFWSLAYNSIAVGLAAASRLDPLVAAVAMIGSSLLVLGNSRRLERGGARDGALERSDGRGIEIASSDVGAPVGAVP